MPETSPSPAPRRAADILLYVALILFAAGVLSIVAIFGTRLIADKDPAGWLYLVAMGATPFGFVLAFVYVLLSGRRAR